MTISFSVWAWNPELVPPKSVLWEHQANPWPQFLGPCSQGVKCSQGPRGLPLTWEPAQQKERPSTSCSGETQSLDETQIPSPTLYADNPAPGPLGKEPELVTSSPSQHVFSSCSHFSPPPEITHLIPSWSPLISSCPPPPPPPPGSPPSVPKHPQAKQTSARLQRLLAEMKLPGAVGTETPNRPPEPDQPQLPCTAFGASWDPTLSSGETQFIGNCLVSKAKPE